MSMPTPCLKEFAQAIPVCEQTSGLAEVLEIFRSSGCEAIVVVSRQRYPLGVVNLPKVMPYLISRQQSGETSLSVSATDGGKPLSQLAPPIIEPLAILPAHLSLSQFWPYLQGSGEAGRQASGRVGEQQNFTSSPPHSCSSSFSQQWALVDHDGKFLGLLNSWLLLKSLAPKFLKTQVATVEEQPQSTGIKLLIQLLEQLPLPLSLQTTTGQVLAQNQTWRQQIGSSPNLDWVRRTTAAMLDVPPTEARSALNKLAGSQETATLPLAQTEPSCEPLLSVSQTDQQRCRTSVTSAVQRFCAIDTPRLAAAVSTQQVILSAPPINQTAKPLTHWETSTPACEPPKTSQERVFSFAKIPLSPAVFAKENEGEGENEPGLNSSLCHPSLCDLCVVLAQDTTEQQQVAKELAAKNADLVHLNRLKDEFLACISHELKTPLTAVLGLSTLLKDQALGELNERQARYARLIYQSGRQLMTLVNDILDLTRMETGQLELILEPVQIQSVCDRAYSQAQQLHQEKDQTEDSSEETKFTLELEDGLEMLVADELRLRQMLAHLLSNALKFTDAGGEIGLKVNRWEGWIAFTVWDTGIGIPPEKQHLIFQKFQQLEHPLTRRFEGTGLGLVLTQRLARLHGGDISFISKAGEGSDFTLLLPPCPPQGRSQDGHLSPCPISNSPSKLRSNRLDKGDKGDNVLCTNATEPQGPIRNRLVLIVETVPTYLENLTEQLKSLGYRVVIARSGTEAIEKARGLQPCAVLLNPLLPQLSGWDVLTLLKSDAQTRHIPVLVTATQAEKQQAYQNKADGFLNLPVQKQALLQNLTGLEEQECPPSKTLTILHLSPVETDFHSCGQAQTHSDSCNLSSGLTDILNVQHSELNYRVLEADDLEQAELLARVWHPDVVLLDAAQVADPLELLTQFSLHPHLISLPLVTLDHPTTEAANQVTGLSVYPCLAPDNSSKMAALLQVIQVAAGISRLPSILVMDIGNQGLTDLVEYPSSPTLSASASRQKNSSWSSCSSEGMMRTHGSRQGGGDAALDATLPYSTRTAPPNRFSPGRREPQPLGNNSADRGTRNNPFTAAGRSHSARTKGGKGKKISISPSLAPQSSWLQALMQYLQTAGFRSVLSYSWIETYRQLQDQSADLLLIRLKDISDASALVTGLIALTQLQKLPPILVLDHRVQEDSASLAALEGQALATRAEVGVMGSNKSTANLDSLLGAIATQILRGHSLTMTQLLDQINQALNT
jgi:signal transduction histidine kinase/DNA-binding response OmpR family regulator